LSPRQYERPKVLIDTAAFVALSDRRDSMHRVAHQIRGALIARRARLLTTNFIFAETHALLVKRIGIKAALEVCHALRTGPIQLVRISEEDEERAFGILTRYTDKDFSYTDATSFAVMERLGIEAVFTFDHHFGQYGFQPLTADPA
jgi:predicted nucleic acid-binding protein